MLQFEKPIYKITDSVESNFYGRFELEPLERGFGTTIGNALRRVMLSSLPGSAISSIKIDGVLHEFQTIDGVYEDVTTIILNLKGIVFKNHSNETKTVRINATKEGEVTAGDIECDADIEVINKDKVIATLSKGGSLNIEMTVTNGRGYVKSEENKRLYDIKKAGVIAIDSLYSPIERVSYEVGNARVGQDESYDKLILDVWTNGSIKPEEAVALASRILIEHFTILTDLSSIADVSGMMIEKTEDPKIKALNQKDAILAKAEDEARIKKEQAQRDIEVEKNRVQKEIRTEIVDVALEVAKKVVGREVEGKDTDRLVDEFLKDN